jgi:REP element-mobilizing transposase RayT
MRHAENRGVDAAPTTMTEQPRGRDLRKGRHSQPSQIYLLTSVSHQRRPVFADFHLGRIVVKAMRHHDLTGHTETLAYVVMPDHFHWLFSLGDHFDLPRLMASLKGYTARCIKEQIDLGDARYGRRATTTTPCGGMKTCRQRPGISWPIPCALGWSSGWGIIRCGMRSGCSSPL